MPAWRSLLRRTRQKATELMDRLKAFDFSRIEVVDEDLDHSVAGVVACAGLPSRG